MAGRAGHVRGSSRGDLPAEGDAAEAAPLLGALAVVGSALAGHALAGRRRQGQGRSRQRAQQVVRQAASGGYLKARERRDGHGWIKEDPEFNPGEASGASVTVELKKRPMGISRYTHGEGGKGAMVVEMTEKARYPGDPRGQCAVGGVKKNMIVKSINGTDVAGWDFSDIMDMLEDTEGDANCTQEAKAAWEARPRNHQAVALPATVTFQESAPSARAPPAPRLHRSPAPGTLEAEASRTPSSTRRRRRRRAFPSPLATAACATPAQAA
ncbi:unnamed protein product [Prorocentrum cordatum]|uniref:PDZ domain-containing protein n=1 Tax=Prorocentrum cordatum TaxID=2364126 RepID=A0ABN9T5W1_9DINO|nr:unnamed protein product [Polarella glacialis]